MEQNNAFIITLTGASMCGKTYVMDKILSLQERMLALGLNFNPVRVKKYTTRNYRPEEISELLSENEYKVDVVSVDKIPQECDLVYQTYGKRYGLDKSQLSNYLQKGMCPVVVINDVRVVEELKREFPKKVLSIYIFREIPSMGNYIKGAESRGGVEEQETLDRYNKAVAIHRTYIENITLFNRVILNVKMYEGKDNEIDCTALQIENVIKCVLQGKISLDNQVIKGTKLFIISGNAASGKDEIIQSINEMGKLQAFILPKFTSRMQDFDDGSEMICHYSPKENILTQLQKEYVFEYSKSRDKLTQLNTNLSQSQSFAVEVKIQEQIVKDYARALSELKEIKTPLQRFWSIVDDFKLQRYRSFSKEYAIIFFKKDIKIPNELKKVKAFLSEAAESNEELKKKLIEFEQSLNREVLDKFFQKNLNYIDLEKIRSCNLPKIKTIVNKQVLGMTGPSYLVYFNDVGYIMYENNDTLYGFATEVNKNKRRKNLLVEQLNKNGKHGVLVASLIDVFKICRDKLGRERVKTVFAYSQISADEYSRKSRDGTVDKKLKGFEREIEKYSRYIEDFDYTTIYAESVLGNSSGSSKEELIDQMFRLFRAYN